MTPAADGHTKQPTLERRTAIVTSETTGIGRAIAVLLASYGFDLFIFGHDSQHLADALSRSRQVGNSDGIAIDLSGPDNLRQAEFTVC